MSFEHLRFHRQFQSQLGVAIHVYDGADRGFGCDARASFHEPSFHLAFDRTTAFLGAHLLAV